MSTLRKHAGNRLSNARFLSAILAVIGILSWTMTTKADITTGLVAYWTFNEASGAVAADSSGNANTVTLVNGATRRAGRIGNAVSFNQSADYGDAGNGNSIADIELQGGGGMTLAFWANPAVLNDSYIFSKGLGSAISWRLTLTPAGRLTFTRNYSGADDLYAGYNSQLVANQWHHFVLLWDGTANFNGVQLYRDAVLQTPTFGGSGIGSKVADAPNYLYIGGMPGAGTANISLDDVRLYNRRLSATDIGELFQYSGGPSDSVPPVRSNGRPSSQLPSGTTSTTLGLSTNEAATCKYGTVPGAAYASIANTFASTGTTTHNQSISGLTNGSSVNYYIRCRDVAGNVNPDDFVINVSVAGNTSSSGGFQETPFVTGLESPTSMTFTPDGRLFILERTGRIRVVRSGSMLPTPFKTFTTNTDGERGLLGIELDPSFASNGYVYVYYTATTPTIHNRVSRLRASTANPDVSDGTETILFDLGTLNDIRHNGGAMHFGSDGKLYVAVGDNGYQFNSQSIDTLFGKMLRLNSNGSIPTDNPTSFPGISGTTTGVNRAIWAVGLRNPYTFAVDSVGNRIYVNDVGSNDSVAFEEIDLLAMGANYGWPYCEGGLERGTSSPCSNYNPSFTVPIHSYAQENGRGNDGSAITGAWFYRGGQLPSEYNGAYFFADVVDNFIDVMMPSGEVRNVIEPTAGPGPLDIDMGPDGALYYLSYAWVDQGGVYKVSWNTSGNSVPVARVTAAPTSGPAPLAVSFDGSTSSDADNDPLVFSWNFGDGSSTAGAGLRNVNHTYSVAGQYMARLRVTDPDGVFSEATVTIVAGSAPSGTITSPANGTLYSGGQTFTYSGTATDAEDGPLPPSAFSWTIVFHHATHTHPFLGPINGVRSGSFTIPATGETATDVFYRIHMLVTDSSGIQQESTVDLLPRKTNVTLAASTAGLSLMIDGESHPAPYTFESVSGIVRTISAPSPQTFNGQTYNFANWSQGGAATQQISTPSSATTYTANYTLTASGPTGLVARWRFDDGSGSSALDSSGNGYTMTLYNSPSWVTGRSGRALSFNRASDYGEAGSGPAFQNIDGGGLTIAFWANPASLTGDYLLRKGSGSDFSWRVSFTQTGILSFFRNYGGASDLGVAFPAQFVVNQWHYYVFVWNGNSDGGSVRLYRDGIPQTASYGTAGVGNKVMDTNNALYVGGISGMGQTNVTLDDLRIYNRPLSESEVDSLYGAP